VDPEKVLPDPVSLSAPLPEPGQRLGYWEWRFPDPFYGSTNGGGWWVLRVPDFLRPLMGPLYGNSGRTAEWVPSAAAGYHHGYAYGIQPPAGSQLTAQWWLPLPAPLRSLAAALGRWLSEQPWWAFGQGALSRIPPLPPAMAELLRWLPEHPQVAVVPTVLVVLSFWKYVPGESRRTFKSAAGWRPQRLRSLWAQLGQTADPQLRLLNNGRWLLQQLAHRAYPYANGALALYRSPAQRPELERLRTVLGGGSVCMENTSQQGGVYLKLSAAQTQRLLLRLATLAGSQDSSFGLQRTLARLVEYSGSPVELFSLPRTPG
jgi:hypothetical protein